METSLSRPLPIIVVIALLAGISASSYAQIRPSRTWLATPLASQSASGPVVSLQGGAAVDRTAGSTYNEQAWQFRTHFAVEPFRFTDSSDAVQVTTSVEAHQEMTANPLNEISFNPRTMRWEEIVQVHVGTSLWSVRAGWLHRCKHDLDNLDGPSELIPSAGQPIMQRTIILSGPTIAGGLAPFLFLGGNARVEGGAEWFVVRADYRQPSSAASTATWRNLQGAVWGRGVAQWNLGHAASIHTLYYLSVPVMDSRQGLPVDKPIPHEARIEVALGLRGKASVMELVLSAEHTFDELSYIDAQPSTYAGIGLRFRPTW
jgi:hypothetical protein